MRSITLTSLGPRTRLGMVPGMVRNLVPWCRSLAYRLLTGTVHDAPAAQWPRLLARATRIVARHAEVFLHPTCGVCGGDTLQPAVAGSRPIGLRLHPGGRRIPFGALRLPLIYKQCVDCGAARIAPTFRDTWIDNFDERAPSTAATHWMEDLGYVEDKQRSIATHYERAGIDRFRSDRNSVLDVSCGAGVGLAVLRDRFGWRDCQGVECDPEAVRIANEQRGLIVAHGLLHTVDLPANHFDLVVMDNALEHHANPRQALQLVRRALRPGGAVLIVVPNFHGHHRRATRHRLLEPQLGPARLRSSRCVGARTR